MQQNDTMCHVNEAANKAVNPDTGKLSEYPVSLKSTDGIHWEESCCEEIGRLAQGCPPTIPKGTETTHFIKFDEMPNDRTVTHLRLVVAVGGACVLPNVLLYYF